MNAGLKVDADKQSILLCEDDNAQQAAPSPRRDGQSADSSTTNVYACRGLTCPATLTGGDEVGCRFHQDRRTMSVASTWKEPRLLEGAWQDAIRKVLEIAPRLATFTKGMNCRNSWRADDAPDRATARGDPRMREDCLAEECFKCRTPSST